MPRAARHHQPLLGERREQLARLDHARVVRAGVHQRWLVEADAANKPVLGIRPAHAREYAAWRGAAEGIAYGLPTASEWQRLAAVGELTVPGNEPLFEWHARMGAPTGVRHLFDGPGEIVDADDGSAFVVKGRGGILPMVSAVLRNEPVAGYAQGHRFGFRLVYRP